MSGPYRQLGIYARISHDPDGKRVGVTDQLADCRAAIQSRPTWHTAGEYVDNDISAEQAKRARPEYRRLLEDLRAGHLDGIVVAHLDRLYRQPRELEDLIDLYERRPGLILHTVHGADFDLTTSDGRAMARVTVAFAKKESEDKRRRQKRRTLQKAQAGEPSHGGTRPFGYENDRVTIRPDEAALVQEAVRRIIAGETLRSLAVDWQRRDVRTPTGRHWQPPMLRRMLLAPRVAGLRQHQGDIIGTAVWPALVDRAQWEQATAILRDPGRRRNRGIDARRYLLPGFIYCSRCEQRMVARPRADRKRAYVCAAGPGLPGCGRMSRLADPVEELVRDAVTFRLGGGDLTAMLTAEKGAASSDRHRQAAEEFRQAEERLDQITRDYADGILDRRAFLLARERATGTVDRLRRQMLRAQHAAVAASIPAGEAAFARAWSSASLEWRRAVLDLVIDRVVVHPARRGFNRFDPDCIELRWKV